MRYVSTRGGAPSLSFEGAVLAGLAEDGGLYLPEAWPKLSPETIAAMAGRPFAEVAATVIAPYVGDDLTRAELDALCREAYATFTHAAVCPLVQTSPADFILELFHGPTLAFKDVAMQLLARLMDHVLTRRDGFATIVGATSGDTGAAAIEAFAGRDRADVFILFPEGRVSEVQRRQMTTATAGNVGAIAIQGNFDDCQAMVKGMFANTRFRDRVKLSGVNSINWARIVAQATYYFTAAVALGAPGRAVAFSVPTGNFGDVFAGYVAERMGLPVRRLVVATNVNDILARTLATGVYEVRGVAATTSPSMDIQVSSNFERLLFEAHGRDPEPVRRAMASLRQSGRFEIPDAPLARMRVLFEGHRASEAEVATGIAAMRREAGYLMDPHTSVGVMAACRAHVADAPMVTLATAHPAKFPDAVEAACGERPALPPHLADLHGRPERYVTLPNDQAVVEAHILSRARAAA
jgi:threonine synthase